VAQRLRPAHAADDLLVALPSLRRGCGLDVDSVLLPHRAPAAAACWPASPPESNSPRSS
jgi:hypothetical protein